MTLDFFFFLSFFFGLGGGVGASLLAVILLFPLKFHLICAQVLSQSRSRWGAYLSPASSHLRWDTHLCVCACLCTFAHKAHFDWACLWVQVCVCVCVRGPHAPAKARVCVSVCACCSSTVSHLPQLEVIKSCQRRGLDRWVALAARWQLWHRRRWQLLPLGAGVSAGRGGRRSDDVVFGDRTTPLWGARHHLPPSDLSLRSLGSSGRATVLAIRCQAACSISWKRSLLDIDV